jgi:hypothetical protein
MRSSAIGPSALYVGRIPQNSAAGTLFWLFWKSREINDFLLSS